MFTLCCCIAYIHMYVHMCIYIYIYIYIMSIIVSSIIRLVFIILNRKISNWASQILKANMLPICPYCLEFQIARVSAAKTNMKFWKLTVCLFVDFLFVDTLHRNVTGISPEFHRNFTGISPEFTGTSPDVRQNSARTSPEYRVGAPL